MGIEFHSVAYGATGGFGATETFPHTVVPYPSQVMFVHTNIVNAGASPVLTVTYGGIALAQVPGATQGFVDGGNPQRQEVWFLVNPPTGVNNVVATWAGGGSTTATSLIWTGVDPTTPMGVLVMWASNNANATTVNVASAVEELVVDFNTVKNINATYAVGAGQTPRSELQSAEILNSNRHRDRSSEEAGQAIVTMSWDGWVAKACGIMGVSLRPFIEQRARAAKYYFDVWDPKPKVRDAVDQAIPSNELRADTWLELQGAKLPTPKVYDSFVQDPSKARIVEVTDQRDVTLKASRSQFADVLIKRAAAGRG